MPPATNQTLQSTDIAATIAAAMREMGVSPLPRNYELLYETFTGSNEELRAEFFSLGNTTTQQALDRLTSKHVAHGDGLGIVEDAREEIMRKLDEIRALLGRERTSLEKYGMILESTSDGLNNREAVTKEFLQKILAITSAATETTREQGKQIANSIIGTSDELASVKSKLEEYKKLATTDPLTQLSNRRAFDTALTAVFENRQSILFNALILADIDRFKSVNDHFGHPVGDRIIQLIGGILRNTASESAFVARTGGEEFAIIVDGLGEDAVERLADQIRAAIEKTVFANRESGTNYGPVTISSGLCMASEANGPDDLYCKADRALYASKMNGRNRVTRHSTIAVRPGKGWMLYKSE